MPKDRPDLDSAVETLRLCRQELADHRSASVGRCPRCARLVQVAGATHCDSCGQPILRKTHQLTDDVTAGPVERMYEADNLGAAMDVVYYARIGLRDGRLTPAATIRAAEVALGIPGELELVGDLLRAVPQAALADDLQRRYLICIGEYLTRHKAKLDPWREMFREAVAKWPSAEPLWVWLTLASPRPERETLLRTGLVHHPRSQLLRFHLGRFLYDQDQPEEALAEWERALDCGHRSLKFLIGLCQLAEQLDDQIRLNSFRGLLLSYDPGTPEECLELSKVAEEAKDINRAMELADRGLRLSPFDAGLEGQSARLLYQNCKYELLDERFGKDPRTPDLKGWVALALYQLGHYAVCPPGASRARTERWTRLSLVLPGPMPRSAR